MTRTQVQILERIIAAIPIMLGVVTVSYTHLDVYKRQVQAAVIYHNNPVCVFERAQDNATY